MVKLSKILVLLTVWCCILLIPGTSSHVWAEALPETYIMHNYWFYGGYLAENVKDAGFSVIPEQPVLLYETWDSASSVVGTLQPGQESKLRGITYVAQPGKEKIEVKKRITATDGKTVLQPGDVLGFVSQINDCVVVYYNNTIAFASLDALGESAAYLRKFGRGAERQWLYLDNGQGLAGWCQFSNGSLKNRWRIQPNPAGGSHDLNVILFGDHAPVFQQFSEYKCFW